MKRFILFGIIFLIGFISACSSGQIDINSGNAQELDEITYVGSATAEKIISARPFNSIDDLIRVSGIGETKLAAIKEQGLACVKTMTTTQEEDEEDEPEEESDKDKKKISDYFINFSQIEEKEEVVTISITPQTIKTEEISEESENRGAIYGLILFCVLLSCLYLIRKNKNEFG